MRKRKSELIQTRAKLMQEMDEYINNEIGDEDIIDYWLMYGVPDDSDIEDLYDIAMADDIWCSVCDAFGKCLVEAGIIG